MVEFNVEVERSRPNVIEVQIEPSITDPIKVEVVPSTPVPIDLQVESTGISSEVQVEIRQPSPRRLVKQAALAGIMLILRSIAFTLQFWIAAKGLVFYNIYFLIVTLFLQLPLLSVIPCINTIMNYGLTVFSLNFWL